MSDPFCQYLDTINARFNEDLQMQIGGDLPRGHIYALGTPGKILRSAGMDNLPIELIAGILSYKASEDYHHPFNISDAKNLPKAINDPLAIFAYGDRAKAVNVVLDTGSDNKNLLVGISLNPEINGIKLNAHSVRTIFPKNVREWLNWIEQGKTLYLNKKNVLRLIANPGLPEDVTKAPALIAKTDGFQNPPV